MVHQKRIIFFIKEMNWNQHQSCSDASREYFSRQQLILTHSVILITGSKLMVELSIFCPYNCNKATICHTDKRRIIIKDARKGLIIRTLSVSFLSLKIKMMNEIN